jgi:hypothetical protein
MSNPKPQQKHISCLGGRVRKKVSLPRRFAARRIREDSGGHATRFQAAAILKKSISCAIETPKRMRVCRIAGGTMTDGIAALVVSIRTWLWRSKGKTCGTSCLRGDLGGKSSHS